MEGRGVSERFSAWKPDPPSIVTRRRAKVTQALKISRVLLFPIVVSL